MTTHEKLVKIGEKLASIDDAKASIRLAIISKGVDVQSNIALGDLPSYVNSITGSQTEDIFIVRFLDSDASSVLKQQRVLKGGDVIPPVSPQKVGYTFKEWSASSMNIQSNLDVLAVFVENSLKVVLLDYDLKLLSALQVAPGSNASANNPQSEHLTFTSWANGLAGILDNRAAIALYSTEPAGVTYLYITLTAQTGLNPTFNIWTAEDGNMSIDFGDGNISSLANGSPLEVAHTYSNYGDYLVKITGNGSCGWNGGMSSYERAILTGTYASAITRCYEGASAKINGFCFQGCNNLKSVLLNNARTTIYKNTFDGCTSLKTIVIPSLRTSIGESAFRNCSQLESIVFLGAAPTIAAGAFSGLKNTCCIFAQGDLLTSYQELFSAYEIAVKNITQLPLQY